MVENHGVFPWPEATATTEIIVTGEKAGNQAKTLAVAALIGGLYDGLANLFRAMAENIRLANIGPSQWLGRAQERAFMRFDFLNSAATLGIGYIIGLRYTAIIAAGSFFSTFVLVPMVHGLAGYMAGTIVPPGAVPIDAMGPAEIFKDYVRIMGVGCIAGAGVLGVLSSLPNMMRSIASNMRALAKRGGAGRAAPGRTERGVPGHFVAAGLAVAALATVVFFSFGIGLSSALVPALVGTAVVMVISFFFAPVAARAIATIGTNPISGMTMLTLLITGLGMLRMGFAGGTGMFVTMMVGGVVCTALAASGAFSTDLKIGHWIGATPARQIGWKFVGTLTAALFCGVAMFVMNKGGFGEGGQYTAPQASAMRAILEGVFSATATPLRWHFFGLGVALSLVLRLVQLPALGFALGMYLPIELNTPLFLGGVLSHMVNKKKVGDTEEGAKARENKGILVASGLMAGGAIMGVVGAIVRMNPAWKDGFYILKKHTIEGAPGEWLAILGMAALCLYVVAGSRRSG
jgi:putative OPT family oligopeptide transporter